MERLKSRLYTRKSKETPSAVERSPLSQSEAHAPSSWSDVRVREAEQEPQPQVPVSSVEAMPPETQQTISMSKRHMSFATKFFIGSIVFFVLAAGVSALLFFGGVNTTSPRNIDVEVVAPSLVDGGKEATLQFIITNRNTTNLELADLVIDYPEGTRSSENPTDTLTHERVSLGTVKPGQQIKRTATALFYGQEGEQQKVVGRIEYSVAGSNGVFEKEGEASFTIGSAPVSVTVDAPSHVTAGEDFLMTLTVRSNTTKPVDDVTIEAQYPFGFSVSETQPAGSVGGRLWRLGTMQPGTSKTIRIGGSIEASDGDERIFRFLAGSNSDPTDTSVKVPFLTIPQTLTIERPFISGSVSVEGKSGSDVAVAAGKQLQGTVAWENNLSEAVSDVELELSLVGPALDKDSINAQSGFYQSKTSSILWTQDRDDSLELVPPGGKGTFQFSFSTLEPGVGGVLITNPTITLSLTVRAKRQGGSGSDIVTSVATTKVTLASQLELLAEASYAKGPFSNTGPTPPQVEKETSYTVTWTVKNSANTTANTTVEATLPPYVEYKAAQAGKGITYDAASRTVRWSLGDVHAGVGYTTDALQGSFQVVLTPSTSQINTYPALTGTAKISGQDRFAQVQVEGSAQGPTTNTGEGGSSSVEPQ